MNKINGRWKSEGRLGMEERMGGDALICSSRFDICPTPLSSLFFYVCSFSFKPIFLSLKLSFFLLQFWSFSFFLLHSLSRASNTLRYAYYIYITPSKAVHFYSLKWLRLRKVHAFIFSLDSFFLLPSWLSAVTLRRWGSQKREQTKEGSKIGDFTWLTKLGNESLFLLYFFYLFSFFLSFYDYYYWTRFSSVASDPGNSWFSVKKRVLSFEGFLVIPETLLFLGFFLMTLFFYSIFLVRRDNECWLCFPPLSLSLLFLWVLIFFVFCR